ncbi:MAG: hypothetical protein ABEJ35_07190 [Halobacteriaceae archaeon]
MKEAPGGTPVGVDDPYAFAGRCDFVTEDGRCRFARDHADVDPAFAAAREAAGFGCPVAEGEWDWTDCPKYRSRSEADECRRCGLSERRQAHEDTQPLIEEHHLSYDTGAPTAHEITVALCRWCHAKVHQSFARIEDDARPDTAALAEHEARRSAELEELSFETAAERETKDR